MVRLPEWKPTEYGYYNRVGVYRLYLENDGMIWKLQVWEGERTVRRSKRLEVYHFMTSDADHLKIIAFDCLNSVLERIA